MPLQTQWRVVCALTTAGAGLMTWYGMTAGPYFGSPLLTLIFWSIVIALIAATFFLVMLDVRFIRLRYALERQKLFKETLGSEDFRRALIRNQNKKNDSEPDTPPPSE